MAYGKGSDLLHEVYEAPISAQTCGIFHWELRLCAKGEATADGARRIARKFAATITEL